MNLPYGSQLFFLLIVCLHVCMYVCMYAFFFHLVLDPERGKYKAWNIQHSLDIWHAAKSLCKKLTRVSPVVPFLITIRLCTMSGQVD